MSLFNLNAGLDRIEGISTESKFGSNAALQNGTYEVVWTPGTTPYPFPTAALAARVKAGGDAADAAAGAGARSVTVSGLDANWDPASETITLNANGTLVSDPTTTTFIRVNRAYVASVGAYGAANTAAITLETTAGTTLAIIGAGLGQTEMAIYTVRAGYKAALSAIHFSADATQSIDVRMYQRQDADDVATPFTPKRLVAQWLGVLSVDEQRSTWPVFPAKTDLWFEAEGAGGVSGVSVTFDIILTNLDTNEKVDPH